MVSFINYVVENRVTELKSELNSMFDKHNSIIGELQKKFKFESAWWLVLQHDINTISILREKVAGF